MELKGRLVPLIHKDNFLVRETCLCDCMSYFLTGFIESVMVDWFFASFLNSFPLPLSNFLKYWHNTTKIVGVSRSVKLLEIIINYKLLKPFLNQKQVYLKKGYLRIVGFMSKVYDKLIQATPDSRWQASFYWQYVHSFKIDLLFQMKHSSFEVCQL